MHISLLYGNSSVINDCFVIEIYNFDIKNVCHPCASPGVHRSANNYIFGSAKTIFLFTASLHYPEVTSRRHPSSISYSFCIKHVLDYECDECIFIFYVCHYVCHHFLEQWKWFDCNKYWRSFLVKIWPSWYFVIKGGGENFPYYFYCSNKKLKKNANF